MHTNSDKENKRKGDKKNSMKKPSVLKTCLIIFIFLTIMNMSNTLFRNVRTEEVTYDEFLQQIDSSNIESVKVKGDYIIAQTKAKDGIVTQYQTRKFDDPDLVNRLIESGVSFEDVYSPNSIFFSILLNFLPLIILIVFYKKMLSGKNGIMSAANSNAKEYKPSEQTITFANVAGEDEAKESLAELVDFLHNPKKYNEIGAKLPKGALLVGPPGTGKTLLAKAVAGEAGVPFYSLTGSSFVEMYVGVGASRVRDLFKQAKKNAPCIIFIDEIDAIGRKRDTKNGNDERENTLNQLLSEMDGFDASKGIVVLGATNRPEILDKALLRPGRFDRRVIVDVPDLKGRIEILKVHAKNVKLSDDVDFEKIALATSGVSGADLENIINEAAIDAVKRGNLTVSQKDLMNAIEIVLVGKEKKTRVLSEEEKRIVAYHEIGHALVTALQKHTEPIQKITIIPRTKGALGFVMHSPEEERYLHTKNELQEMIITTLAGRAAEEVVFNSITTGASNDIEKATKLAKSMITEYGMSDKFGLIGLVDHENPYLSNGTTLNCSPGMAEKIDEEVMRILKDSYEKAKTIIQEHRDEMDDLAEHLIKHETITGKEFMELLEKEQI